MLIHDGENREARVDSNNMFKVWYPPAGYSRENIENDIIISPYLSMSAYIWQGKDQEKENLLPDHLFEIEE